MWNSWTIHHKTCCAFGFVEIIQISFAWVEMIQFVVSKLINLHFLLAQLGPNYLGALPVAVRVKLSGQRL